ncbi:MAG: PQQ-dependent sugar dehydrogenase [Acidimicrobiia bacterium]|nr:PQQ-dependent sugar dehydrogenase [Acidimicrobiia bacterium]
MQERVARRRSLYLVLMVATTMLVAGWLFAAPGAGAVDPDDFVDELRVTGMTRVVAVEWLPSGEALILAQSGVLWKADPATGAKSQYLSFPDVDNNGERGTLDLVLDESFATNGYIYVYFTSLSDQKLNIGRFTYTGAGAGDLGSLTVLWSKANNSPNTNHVGGSLDIGPDGHLYLSMGDSVQSQTSQSLDTVFGKILRIATDGSIPTDNPFHDGAGPHADEIYAYGVRNPWRGSFDDVTGTYFFGDVGGNDAPTAYEEINVLVEGANYGWADCQGPLGPPKNGPNCPGGVTAPIWYYDHDPGGGCCSNAAVTGGEVMRGITLPTDLDGAYIYADYSMGEIRYLELGANNAVTADGLLRDNVGAPVWIGQGPDGHIYYLQYGFSNGFGQLRRLRYVPTQNLPPVITSATATPTSGTAPLNVAFSAAAYDPNGDPITWEWDFGDGTSSNQQNPSHTYAGGTYEAQLRVTAGGDITIGSIITISAGSPPTASIVTPSDGSFFSAGDSIPLEGSATDDGPITDADYSWDVSLVHGNHEHPILTDLIGRNQTLNVATTGHGWEGDTSILIELTVTDAEGLSDDTSVEIEPRKVAVTVDSEAGYPLTVDGVVVLVPFVIDTIEGFEHSISTIADVCTNGDRWMFDDWSDGVTTPTRSYVVPAGPAAALTARYTNTGPCLADCMGIPATVVIANGDTPTGGDDVIVGTTDPDTILAGDGDDLVCGGGGGDTINGGLGADTVYAEDGDDIVYGQDGDDQLHGGTGNDTLLGFGGNDIAWGDAGDDVLNGGVGDDVLFGHGGQDQLFGQAGVDVLLGGADDDLITGSDDPDWILGEDGDDVLNGGAGNDGITGGSGDDVIYGGAGDDRAPFLNTSGLVGDGGADLIFGQLGADIVRGGPGNDRLWGNEEPDTVFGGSGDDTINGGPADDSIDGQAGSDTLFGDGNLAQAGDDTLIGGVGPDLLLGFAGADTLDGQDGEIDTVNGGPDADTCTVDVGVDVVYGCP